MSRIIVVVDDSAVVRASVKYALEKVGFRIIEASNGREGMQVLLGLSAQERPVMIITDVNMPEMDGITFVKEVKKSPYRFVPVLVLTTESQSDKKAAGKAAGAAGWLVKPFQEDQLAAAVKKLAR